MNSIGRMLRLTTWGESHGVAIGGILDGVPSGLCLPMQDIERQLSRRRPGQSAVSTPRSETDKVYFDAGVYEGYTLGSPIAFHIDNRDTKSSDYEVLKSLWRPSHADYVYEVKYGRRDHRGGGRSSARETAVRVVGGTIAREILRPLGVEIYAYSSNIGGVALETDRLWSAEELLTGDQNPVRCPDPEVACRMIEVVESAQEAGDSVGGIVTCIARGIPAGWGEPLYDKLSARLASYLMSINAARGVELGDGFDLVNHRGSAVADTMYVDSRGGIRHSSNHSGGILGGISNGEEIRMRIAFKPTASISKPQKMLSPLGEEVEHGVRGRHDPCVVPRAVPVVEAMVALCLADFYLLQESYHSYGN